MAEQDPAPAATATTEQGEPTPLGSAAAFLAVTMWGLGNVIVAGVPLNGLALGTYRLGLGSLVYAAVLYARGGRLTVDSFRYGWKGGLAFGLDIAAFFLAVRNTTVSVAVTLSALQPVVIAGFAAIMFGEHIRPRHVIATLVAIPAVGLVAFGAAQEGGVTLFGNVMAVLALFVWAAYFITSKQARERLPLMEYMTALNMVAFLTVAILAVATGSLTGEQSSLSWTAVLGIVAVLALPGSGHIFMNWAHQHTNLMLTSLATLSMPVTSTLAAWVFLDQTVTWTQAIGIVVVLTALAAVVIGDSREPRRLV